MPTAVIVDAVRSPLGRRNGKLKDTHPVDLAAHSIQGHREVRAVIRYRPSTSLFLRGAVYDSDTVGIRHIDENLTGAGIDLEAFGVRLNRYIGNFAAVCWIDDG